MDLMTECTCTTDVADALRAHLEGREVEPCVVHRPEHMLPASAPALNSDQLADTLTARLNATDLGANL